MGAVIAVSVCINIVSVGSPVGIKPFQAAQAFTGIVATLWVFVSDWCWLMYGSVLVIQTLQLSVAGGDHYKVINTVCVVLNEHVRKPSQKVLHK